MRNYIFKRSENWKPKDAGLINEWLEKINGNESETHYMGVVVSGFTWQQNYAYEATGSNELADKLFSEVEKRQEVVTTFPKDNKSFMPYSSGRKIFPSTLRMHLIFTKNNLKGRIYGWI